MGPLYPASEFLTFVAFSFVVLTRDEVLTQVEHLAHIRMTQSRTSLDL